MTRPDETEENTQDGDVLAVVSAAGGRRLLGLVALAGLGVLLIYVAVNSPPSLIWQVFLIGCGASAILLADKMRRSTAQVIELTRSELRDTSGTVLARVEDIVSIDRGVFAFKPSNGFLLVTRTPGARAWRPGLWWRLGRRVGVGGMTRRQETKYMSEVIATLVDVRTDD